MQVQASSAKGPILPHQLPIWVPGKVLGSSDAQDWRGVSYRLYEYEGQDVEIPPMDCHMLVQYVRGETPMDRRVEGGGWTRTRCNPGNFSLLSRVAESHWHWTSHIHVNHVYLTKDLINRVAGDIRGEEVSEVHLHDIVEGEDETITRIVGAIAREANDSRLGGRLYAETLAIQLAVELLRNFASCVYRRQSAARQLSPHAIAMLAEYVESRLDQNVAVDEMASVLGMGVWTFNRHLNQTIGKSAYAFVLERRMARASALLRDRSLPMKEIAAACGFSDQAHMTRMFRAKLGVTPGQYRASA